MLLSGWLTKKGSANAFSSGNTWRRRYFVLCAPASGHGGAVLKYFTSDAAGSAPRGETPIQPNSAVRVLDNEAALVEHGLSAKLLGKRLLAFHEAPARGERDLSRAAGKNVRTSSSICHALVCTLSFVVASHSVSCHHSCAFCVFLV